MCSSRMLLRSVGHEFTRKKGFGKKTEQKSTYPPPADGLCVIFLCNSPGSANPTAARAARGPLQVIGLFIL